MTRFLTLAQAWNASLQAGDVIYNLNSMDDYNNVEVLAAERFKAELRETTFFADPLESVIRPPKFIGELRSGIAIVSPTQLERINIHRARLGNPLLAEEDVLTFIVQCDLYSAAHGVVGQVTREVTYFYRSQGTESHIEIHGKIGRKLWAASKNEIGEQLTQESIERAAHVRAYALRHLYGGGAPQ